MQLSYFIQSFIQNAHFSKPATNVDIMCHRSNSVQVAPPPSKVKFAPKTVQRGDCRLICVLLACGDSVAKSRFKIVDEIFLDSHHVRCKKTAYSDFVEYANLEGAEPMSQSEESVIASLAEQDQDDRAEYLKSPTPENWQYVTERDRLRRVRIVEIMQAEKLSTANDYFNAGLIMIHGISTEEFILSHVFAMAALAKGHPAAAWLSAVTLDSLMQSLEQDQVFDTYPLPENVDEASKSKTIRKTVFITESIKTIFKPISTDEDSD